MTREDGRAEAHWYPACSVKDVPRAAAESAVRTNGDAAEFLELIRSGDAEGCQAWLEAARSTGAVRVLSRLDDEDRSALLGMLTPELAAEVLTRLPGAQAIEAIEDLDASTAAGIIEELDSDEQADVIKALDSADAEAILTEMDEVVANDIRQLVAYDDDTAGALMVTEFLSFPASATIRDVLLDIEEHAEEYAHYDIQYTYVIDADGRLLGVLPLRSLLLARRGAAVGDVMIAKPITVGDTMPLEELRGVFREHRFIGLPVVNPAGTLLGVVERRDVMKAEVEQAEDLYRQSQGIVGGEELRSMPLLLRSRRRLMWLSANIVLNIIAASMIAFHQDTLEAVIALAVFLPIISDMSGCSGNQAVAVSMRELTLGVTRPQDLLRVLFKECSLGIINGIALGILIGAVAYLWKGNIYLSLVVGAALALNTVVAVAIGGLVPLILKRFKTDPALASGPILTTITDMCGFFIILTLAAAMLSRLT